eukprot:TRINITY_DN4598_c0_g1_i3.p1 TRINITY_DN4598_c0_g1~~TRINITY_DN4598_c0_g1_i3.p1  ORF type:complete len:321 (+),score=76.57 TRINITY_DN4598_c0_g1_i3:53-1015(+)
MSQEISIQETDALISQSYTRVKEQEQAKTETSRKEVYSFLNEENKSCWELHFTKGTVSNYITFLLMVLGFIIKNNADGKPFRYIFHHTRQFFFSFTNFCVAFIETTGEYILAVGLFGFSGGITNWLAVKMLFDKIPFIYGSGVIPSRFKEIRQTVKNTIMATFFDKEYLNKYIHHKTETLKADINIEAKLQEMFSSPQFDEILTRELNALATKPEGAVFAFMGLAPIQLKPMIKPFLTGMGSSVGPLLLQQLDPTSIISIERVQHEIDDLMTTKLEELTPEIVKKLMERVIREHLGWLVVWGNIFGGFIGLIAQLVNDLS